MAKETKQPAQLVLARVPSGELFPMIDGAVVEGFVGSAYHNTVGQATSLCLWFDPRVVTFTTFVPKYEIN